MAFTERTSVSGTALSYLLKECVNSPNRQEGFLFGNITEQITNHISDSRTDNARVEIMVNVTSMLPAPETGWFYSPSGRIKEDILQDMLEGVAGDVVGWYHFRQNNSLKPTIREKIVCKGLQKYFAKLGVRYFLWCNVTCKQTLSNSTHTYTYRFYKVNDKGDIEGVTDVTNNLGENVSGYKRTSSGDINDPFNKAVLEATKDGSRGVAEAVRLTLEKAAADSARWESTSREIASDINCMLAMLANHYQVRHNNISRKTSKQEEQAVIEPIVEALATTTKQCEPFDFITEVIKSNLKQNENLVKNNSKPNTTPMSSKTPLVNSCSSFEDNITIIDGVPNIKVCNASLNSEHSRIHSEGTDLPDNASM